MRKIILCCAGLFCVSGSALFGAACVPGTLQDYIDLGSTGCSRGSTTFSAFNTVPGQSFATELLPSAITVTPGGGLYAPTLLFTLNKDAAAGELFESIFRLSITGTVTGASVALNSPSATGDGVVTGILDVCAGGSFAGNSPSGCAGMAATALAAATAGGPNQLSDSASFPASSFFDVFVDLSVDGGLDGSATLTSATLGVSSVPEPSTIYLLAAGVSALGVIRLRRKSLMSTGRNKCSS